MEKVISGVLAIRFTQWRYPKRKLVTLRGVGPLRMKPAYVYINTYIDVYTYMFVYNCIVCFLKLFTVIF